MSALPGRRHRTLAPSSVLREADVAAMEAANAVLRDCVHALRSEELDILGGRRGAGAWSDGDEEKIVAAAAGDVVRFDLPMWGGSTLVSIDLWSYQKTADQPITCAIELAYPREGVVVPLIESAEEQSLQRFVRRRVGLISARDGRVAGWKLPTSALEIPKIRIVAGDADDAVQGITLWFKRSPQ